MKTGRVLANGVEFEYLEEGEGPLVLLLHGFPDNARTWSHLMPALASSGYRAVAPFMRGYPPTQIPQGYYDTATLANDARSLIEALAGEASFVVGHDWGAATTYLLTAAYPEAVTRAVTLALPHPALIAQAMFNPETIHRAFHFWFFQMQGLPEMAVRANDYAFIDYLWNTWSPGIRDAEQIASVKATLSEPGALEAALGYYRAMFDPQKQDPAYSEARAAYGKPISVPMLTMIGSSELTGASNMEAQAAMFSGPFRFEAIERTGHFLHREEPEAVGKLILDWLG